MTLPLPSVLGTSSWSGLSSYPDASSLIASAESRGLWPSAVYSTDLHTPAGLTAPCRGVVADYPDRPSRVLGAVGDRYRPTSPAEWRSLVDAAVAAGGRPTGAYAFDKGSKICATFEVGQSNGLRTEFTLVDSFDGSCQLMGGSVALRVRCANQFSRLRRSGLMGQLRHTAALEHKIKILAESIGQAIRDGESVRATYQRSESTYLPGPKAKAAFDRLFPLAPKDAPQATRTRAENVRAEARAAAQLPINKVGEAGCLATLWNAATYLVDRRADGSARGKAGLESMLIGPRGDRIQEIQELITVLMADGTEVHVPAAKAIELGADPGQVGAKVVEAMLADLG